ncbi:succinylglutamate desuccinylase/aspartoacylase family protein [Planctomycetota bacterium]|nr:succinylglutamate desuccinylase/aspartoacylase family protein [Planctomycetota bacterium]
MRETHFLSAIAFAACSSFFLTQNVDAQIQLDASFDHASLKASQSFVSSVSGDIMLRGRTNYYGNDWRWLYFKTSNIVNQNPQFWISDDFAGGSSRLTNHKMIYSYDQENWHYFDNNGLDYEGGYKFSNNTNFTQNDVYVAYSFPYSYGKASSHVASLVGNPYVKPTKSANSNLVIGQSPGGVDDLGRVVTPKNLFGYQITDTNSTKPKKKIALTSGLHANEVLGNHTLEGMINMLVSDDPRMKKLRQHADFYVYPMLNPDGRYAGNNRTTVENVDEDPNRLWHPALYQDHKDIKTTADAMIADTDADIDYFIDFHSTIPTGTQTDFGYIPYYKDNHNDPFWLSLKDREPQIAALNSTGTNWYTTNFAESFLDAEFDMTFETMFSLNRSQDYYTDLGESFALAFFDTIVPLPEPTSFMLLSVGLVPLLTSRRKRD